MREIQDYQGQLALLGQENYRLSELVGWKSQELQRAAERETGLREELRQVGRQEGLK